MFAFVLARRAGLPAWILIVGDLAALLPTMPYRGAKKLLWRGYTAFEEFNVQWMANRSLAFANGRALAEKHSRPLARCRRRRRRRSAWPTSRLAATPVAVT
jgi:hypothetical protein